MTTPAAKKVQLNVRVEPRVIELLDAQVEHARHAGHRVSKERLVSDAIMAAYGAEKHPPAHAA